MWRNVSKIGFFRYNRLTIDSHDPKKGAIGNEF